MNNGRDQLLNVPDRSRRAATACVPTGRLSGSGYRRQRCMVPESPFRVYCAPRTGHKMELGELEWTDVQNDLETRRRPPTPSFGVSGLGVNSSSVPAQRNLTGSSISSSPSTGTRPQTPQESKRPTPSESAFACTRPPRTDESGDAHPRDPRRR